MLSECVEFAVRAVAEAPTEIGPDDSSFVFTVFAVTLTDTLEFGVVTTEVEFTVNPPAWITIVLVVTRAAFTVLAFISVTLNACVEIEFATIPTFIVELAIKFADVELTVSGPDAIRRVLVVTLLAIISLAVIDVVVKMSPISVLALTVTFLSTVAYRLAEVAFAANGPTVKLSVENAFATTLT